MRIYGEDVKAFDWNRCIAPAGNMGHVDPQRAADLCDKFGVPWMTEGWPYSSGIKAYCLDDKIWNRIVKMARE